MHRSTSCVGYMCDARSLPLVWLLWNFACECATRDEPPKKRVFVLCAGNILQFFFRLFFHVCLWYFLVQLPLIMTPSHLLISCMRNGRPTSWCVWHWNVMRRGRVGHMKPGIVHMSPVCRDIVHHQRYCRHRHQQSFVFPFILSVRHRYNAVVANGIASLPLFLVSAFHMF